MGKAKLPPEVLLGYKRFRVLPLVSADGDANAGYCHYRKGVIEINVDQPQGEIANTLIHEVLHLLYEHFGMRDAVGEGEIDDVEEYLVNTMANGLTEVFQRNPALVSWIAKSVKENPA